MRRTQLLCMVTALLAVPSFALAGPVDSISPASDTAILTTGQTYSITKTVTIGARSPNDPVDIVFVFDTTDGMQTFFEDSVYGWTKPGLDLPGAAVDVPTALVNIMSGKGYGNVKYGVVTYQDFPDALNATPPGDPWGGPSDVAYSVLTDLTTGANAITAMQGITTGFGDDREEANLHALGTLAEPGQLTWTNDSTRIVVWIGDQPGHPDFELGKPESVPYPGAYNTTSAIASLLAQGIIVEAMDIANLDGSFNGFLAGFGAVEQFIDSGQATAIAAGTGGDYWSGFWNGALNVDRFDGLLAAVGDALDAALLDYIVSLDTTDVDGALGLTGAGGSFTGDRTTEQQFVWNLQYKPTGTGIFDFYIGALVDGLPVAWESDLYEVFQGDKPPPPEIPEPSTVALLGLGLLGVGIAARRRRKK